MSKIGTHWAPFNIQTIRQWAPDEPGVYMLMRDTEIIYIGMTQDQTLKIRLSQHAHSRDACILSADSFSFESTLYAKSLEESLLNEYEKEHGVSPECND